jgi:hypothetical protein
MDIDFVTDLTDGFSISLSDNPKPVSGNRALVNRFELSFLTQRRYLDLGGSIIQEDFGGDARKFIQRPVVLSNTQSISAAISIAIDQTVSSIKNDETQGIPDTERLDSAELANLSVVNGVITATIKINPVQVESYDILQFNLPVTRGA